MINLAVQLHCDFSCQVHLRNYSGKFASSILLLKQLKLMVPNLLFILCAACSHRYFMVNLLCTYFFPKQVIQNFVGWPWLAWPLKLNCIKTEFSLILTSRHLVLELSEIIMN